MTATSTAPSATGRRLRRVLGDWLPVVGVIGVAVISQHFILDARYDVGGHAAEHLAGASAPFMAAAVITLLVWSECRVLRAPGVMAAALAWLATTVLVMVGNLRVVNDLVDAGYSQTPTSSVPDIADHSLANAAPWYAVVASVVLILACRRYRLVGNRVALGATAASMLVPPWIIPGAGAIVLTAAVLWRRAHRHTDSDVADSCAGS